MTRMTRPDCAVMCNCVCVCFTLTDQASTTLSNCAGARPSVHGMLDTGKYQRNIYRVKLKPQHKNTKKRQRRQKQTEKTIQQQKNKRTNKKDARNTQLKHS